VVDGAERRSNLTCHSVTGLVVVAVVDDALAGLDATLDGAGLAITGEGSFDWRSLRDTHVTAVARAAAARGVPCVVLAGQVLVGRREAAAVGVDAEYAVSEATYAVSDRAGVSDGPAADPAGALAALAEDVARRWSR
jgi:glycerate kinase